MTKPQKLRTGAWLLTLAAVVSATLAWGQGIGWQFAGISNYSLFPVFGLLAFSVMWSHYMAAAARRYLGVGRDSLKTYFAVTSLIVLGCILLHPGLLIWQLWRDGLGLPPGSYLNNYVMPTLKWAAMLGSLSLLIFLAYEFHRKYGDKSWWRFVQYASDAAMFLIFIHALKLGRQLQPNWFRSVWIFYGISLLGALLYTYIIKPETKEIKPGN